MSTQLEEGTSQSCKDLVEIKDINGAVLRVMRYRGINFTPFVVGNFKDHIEQIGKMDVRPDDIYIASFPKSGTHWIYEIVNMLVYKTTEYRTDHIFMASIPMEKLTSLESPRIIATHLPYRWLPRQLQENKTIKMINICRNPKDTCVSLYHYTMRCAKDMYDGKWSGFLDLFMRGEVPYGSWFDYVKEWEDVRKNNPQILFVQYEDVKKNFREQLFRISEYLGIACEDSYYDAIERKCCFSQMQKDKVTNKAWSNISRDGTSPIYRKGEIADWKKNFTVAQNENFDDLFKIKMVDSTVKFQFC